MESDLPSSDVLGIRPGWWGRPARSVSWESCQDTILSRELWDGPAGALCSLQPDPLWDELFLSHTASAELLSLRVPLRLTEALDIHSGDGGTWN